MAKDPAFLFYSDNFQSGTQFFTDEQTGKYIRLLCAQHLHGHLSEKHMIHICKTYDVEIFAKFVKDADGNYYNERLESEILRRVNYSKSRASNRKSVNKKQKKPKNISKSYVKHMGNENGNETEDENVIGNWDSTKLNFQNAFEWKEKFCRDKKIEIGKLHEVMREFISDTELKEDYKDLKELKKHFTNWFNKTQNGTHKQINTEGTKLGTSAARIERAKNW